MEKETNLIKEKCKEIILSKKVYVKSDLAYLRYMMRDIKQEELEIHLNSLTMRELKVAIAAGVPGRCQRLALNLLANYKENMEAFLEADGNKAVLSVESLDDE